MMAKATRKVIVDNILSVIYSSLSATVGMPINCLAIWI